jgi:hypothetical protein
MSMHLRGFVLAALDTVVLVLLCPDATTVRRLAALPAALGPDPDAALAVIAAVLLWLLAAWVALALAITGITVLPGRIGALATGLQRRVVPAAARRLIVGAVGLGVVLAPGLAEANDLSVVRPVPVPTWPTDVSTAPSATPATTVPPRTPPTSHTPTSHTPTSQPTSQPTSATPPHPRRPARLPAAAVVVRGGDSLWSIADRQLGSRATPTRIGALWPQWFAANRAVIGTDPDLIRPGQVLHAPTADARGGRP